MQSRTRQARAGAAWAWLAMAQLASACASEPTAPEGPGRDEPGAGAEAGSEARANPEATTAHANGAAPRPATEATTARADGAATARGTEATTAPAAEAATARGTEAAPAPTAEAATATTGADGGAPGSGADAAVPEVPAENRVRGTPPDETSAVDGARRLLEALRRDDPALALDFFFPADAFDLVKAMAVPARYHRRLVRWYEEDVHAEHQRVAQLEGLTFERLQLGRCVWQEIGTEGNKLPYWSCRHNLLFARAGERRRAIEIHVLINWGPRWYITHFGPIR